MASSVFVNLESFSLIIIIFVNFAREWRRGMPPGYRGGLVGDQHAPLPRLLEPLLPATNNCKMYAKTDIKFGLRNDRLTSYSLR